MLFCLLQRRGREGDGEGRSQDAVQPAPPMGDAGEMGGGYTEQLRLQTVLKTGSAHRFQHLQNTCKGKSELWTQSLCLPDDGVCFWSRFAGRDGAKNSKCDTHE